MVGGVAVGGGAPVVVQSMTNTDTADAAGTAAQVAALADAGSEIVRITVNNRAAAERVAEIRVRLRDDFGVRVPLGIRVQVAPVEPAFAYDQRSPRDEDQVLMPPNM